MPTKPLTFLQPYDSETPEPTRHEWMFLPIAPDGRGPVTDPTTPDVTPIATGEQCDAEDLRQFCTDELAAIHPFGWTIHPTNDELNECILNNSERCVISSVTYASDDGWVLVRACGDVEGFTCSVWSPGLPVPEPGVSLALLVGTLALLAIGRRRSLRG
jgi:hypothetical protein